MNLKGPWFYEWLEGPDPPAAFLARCADRDSPQMSTSRVRMPSTWHDAFGAVSGTVLLRRRFGRPSNLQLHERVHVTLDPLDGAAEISVNGNVIATVTTAAGPVSVDLTGQLNTSNELSVRLRRDARNTTDNGRPLVNAAIEIHQQPAESP